MKFYCIADEDTVRGFRLAGAAGCAVSTAQEAADALNQAMAQPDVGIVMLTQQVGAGIREQVDRFRLECDRPLLVEIPGPDGPLPGQRSLRRLAHAAVGFHMEEGG
jgi:V/A-type H+-transporting ATPase subunit F